MTDKFRNKGPEFMAQRKAHMQNIRWTHPLKENPSKKTLAKRRSREALKLRREAAAAANPQSSASHVEEIDHEPNFRPSGGIEDSDDDEVPPPPDPAPCPVRRRMRGKQHPHFGW